MLIDTRNARLPLTIGKLARLVNACNTRVTVLRGQAWITIDGDRRDIVLEAGEQFVIDSNRKVVVYPLRSGSPMEIAIDAGTTGCTTRRRSGFAGWVQAVQAALLPAAAPQLAVV